ncbi:zinc-binding dehydrogenase [Companilactobacillus sp. HBUAS56275]|jgi:NADPH:quinone reductase and related Zn-dependent oxidoreductases|uniref:Zinc-binding dehydrogenase n=1 Tax=Candidatus Companilactobacillus pullicola TaxID=2838523 RepID=A0A9D1ZMD1_9LACO|nr:zinc-binding dehydrogenase [Candidatus Companilactobacillus pullicola]
MKAIVIHETGGPEVLSYEDVPTPEVKPGWSLVKIKAFGINHIELLTRQGLVPDVKLPKILGLEAVGTIAESTSDDLQEGQKVVLMKTEMGQSLPGSYAEYTLLPNDQIYPVDTDFDWSALAAIPETYYTAYGSIKQLHIKNEDEILIRAGSSGVGLAAMRLIKAKYPENIVTASVRNLDKKQELLDMGYDLVVEDKDGKLQTASHFDKALELVGPATVKDTLSRMYPEGIVCETGILGGQATLEDFEPIHAIPNSVYLTSFASEMGSRDLIDEMFNYITHYHVDATPGKVFSFDQVREAHEYMEKNQGIGKVVILN